MKRFLALLLALALVLSVLPAECLAVGRTTEDVWQTILNIEDGVLRLQSADRETEETELRRAFASVTDQVARAVETSSTYVPESLERHGDFFFWQTTDGEVCGYSPALRARIRSGAVEDPVSVPPEETVSYAKKGFGPDGKDVAVFQPYYGLDKHFTDQYANEGRYIAASMGGTATIYRAENATIDQIARSLESCAVVIFDSHGDTDYANPHNQDDFTSQANTSYLCLQSGEGITSQDMQRAVGAYGVYYHAFDGGPSSQNRQMRYYCVDGTAIANHMTKSAPYNMVWSAVCLGMATDGLHAPLRAKGVEVFYGYSQSVTFRGDYRFEENFWSRMKSGSEVKDAAAYMKEQVGVRDPYENNYSAYPIIVSSQDPYPGHGLVDGVQTVRSTWSLIPSVRIKAVSNNDYFGTVSVRGNVITASPREGFAVSSCRVVSGTASLRQNGSQFLVDANADCTVQVNFVKQPAARVHFSVPEGAEMADVDTYVGAKLRLQAPQGAILADKRDYVFLGWTAAPAADTQSAPACIKPGGEYVVMDEDVTLYALYTYSTDRFLKITESRSDWSGLYLLTYNGDVVLDASGSFTGPSIGSSNAATLLESTGMHRQGDAISLVKAAWLYELRATGNGTYTIKMKDQNAYLALTADANSLTTVTNGATNSDAWWWIRYESGAVWIQSARFSTRFLQYQPDNSYFRCYPDYQGPLTLFTGNPGEPWYTTEPQLAYVCQTHSFGAWQTRIPASCTEPGDQIRKCSACKTLEHAPLPALGHNAVTDQPAAADCTHSGLSEGSHCSRCGVILRGQAITPATGHQVVYQPEKTADCVSAGYTASAACETCGKIFVPKTPLPALGHDLETVPKRAPACAMDGVGPSIRCRRCALVFQAGERLPASGHTWDAGQLADTSCGPVLRRICLDCGAERLEALNAENHQPRAAEAAAPTCTEPGHTAGICCAACGAVLEGLEELPAPGHETVLIPERAPTCTEPGQSAAIACTVCAQREAQETLPPLDHDWSEPVVTVPASEGREGETTSTCLRCGAQRKETIPALSAGPCAGGAACPGQSFADMPKAGNWAHDPIDWAVQHGITSGTTATAFAPGATCTRAQVVTFLWRLAGSPEPNADENPFTDVRPTAYYYQPVLWAVENNLTAGTTDTTFAPGAICTRAQVVTFLWRYMGKPSVEGGNPFWDVPDTAYYLQPVQWAVREEVTKGTGENVFSPSATCTRAQVVTFLYRCGH